MGMSLSATDHKASTTYLQENQAVADNLLEKLFYAEWLDYTKQPLRGVEFIISPACNLGCKYCYLNRYHNDLYPSELLQPEIIKQNCLKLLKWLDKHHYRTHLEIFSGELFAQQLGYDILDIIYEYEKNVDPQWRIFEYTIPTNFTFCNSPELEAKVVEYLNKFEELGTPLWLSASFDGIYEECNRPWVRDLDLTIPHTRDKAYYDRVFEFILNHASGLHPMVYSQGIERWKENFEWFQTMMEKADMPWEHLYLLEVRNEEWTPDQIKNLEQFIRDLWAYSYQKCDGDKEKLSYFIHQYTGFNLLVEPMARIARGMPCTVQSDLMIRLGDLKTFPCHRTSYPAFCTGQFVDDEEEELKFVCENAELLCAIYGLHHRTFPYCITCPINHLCSGQCLGACYEATRNLFTPIPSVCVVKYAQIKTHIEMLIKYDLYQEAWNNAGAEQRIQMDNLRKDLAL